MEQALLDAMARKNVLDIRRAISDAREEAEDSGDDMLLALVASAETLANELDSKLDQQIAGLENSILKLDEQIAFEQKKRSELYKEMAEEEAAAAAVAAAEGGGKRRKTKRRKTKGRKTKRRKTKRRKTKGRKTKRRKTKGRKTKGRKTSYLKYPFKISSL